MQNIDLKCCLTLNEALRLLNEGDNKKPIAGGTDVLTLFHKHPQIEQLKDQPIPVGINSVVDISNIAELSGVTEQDNKIIVRAGTTHTEIASDNHIKNYFPLLAKAASGIGSPQIRHRGTIGGNLAHASPAADLVPPLFVLNAVLQLADLTGRRKVNIRKFFTGPGKTVLKPGELIYGISIAKPAQPSIQFYRRIAARKVHACAKVSVAFYAETENGKLKNVNIAFGAVGETVILSKRTVAEIEGQVLTKEVIEKAVRAARQEIDPIDDVRSSGDYRRAMVAEILTQELNLIYLKNKIV